MRTVRSVIILGIVACFFVFKSYFDHAAWVIKSDSRRKYASLPEIDNRKLPSPIVILTYMRSGSSFVGDILQQSKDVFYLFEPLRLPQFAIRENKTYYSLNGDARFYPMFLDAGNDIIRNWTRCNLFDLPNVTWEDSFLFKSNKAKILQACRVFQSQHQSINQTLEYCVGMLVEACFQSKYMVLKTIRLPIDTLMSLMEEFPSMKILHLVRDPRATVLAQIRFGMINPGSLAADAIDFCSRVYRDLISKDILANKFPGRILTFFYEDLAKNPLYMSKLLYKFTGVEYSPDIEKYVYDITLAGKNKDCGNLCTIKSNSSAEADLWRSKIDMKTARIIDQVCRPVYKRLGYREIKSEEMLTNNEIPLRLELQETDDYRYA